METIFIPHSDYLAHHGIKNQKWGQRRFQNYDGSLTSEGRRRYGIGESNQSRRERKQAEKAKAKAAKARAKASGKKKAEAQKLQDQKQKRMEYLRDHPEKIYKYRKELTQDDVTEIMQKVKFDRSLQDIRKEEIGRGMKKIDQIRQNADTALKWYQTGKNAYNTIAEIHNAFIDMGYNKNGKRMLKFGEKSNESLKELEALLKTADGVEQVYKNRDKYSTDDLNKAFKRRQIENLLKNQIEQNKKEDDSSDEKKAEKQSQKKEEQDQAKEKSQKKSKQNDDNDDNDGNSDKSHGVKAQKWDKRSIYDKSFDDVTTEAAKEFVDYLRRKEDRSKTSGEVVNKFLRQLIEEGRYDDANRYFPEEMDDFYRIAKFLNK